MSDSKDKVVPADLALALGLLAQTGRTTGAPPSDLELREWAGQGLSATRQAQVDSYLAHDPDVFARAMRLHAPTKAPATRQHWRAPLALAATVVVLAVALALQMAWRGDPLDMTGSVSEPVLRSADATHPDWRVAAFRAGIAHGHKAASRSLSAPGPQQCLDGERCAVYAQSLAAFGALVAELDQQCRVRGTLPDVDAAGMALDALALQMADSLELAAWLDQVRAGLKATQETPSRVCDYADQMRLSYAP